MNLADSAPEFAPSRGSNPWKVAAENPFGSSWPGDSAGRVSYPTSVQQPFLGIVNNQFWNWTKSGLNYYFNPDTIGPAVYEEMVTADASCYAATEFLTLACLAKFGPYQHPNPKIQDTVNDWLANLITPWLQVLKEQLTAPWIGYSTGEICAEDWIPKQIQGLHPSSLTYDLWLSGPKKNLLRAARQWRYGTFQAYLPADKIIHYAHGQRWGNVFGHSRARPAWVHWFLKAKALTSHALCLERYGSPHSVGTVTGGYEDIEYPPGSGRMMPILDYVNQQLQYLAAHGSLAVTNDIQIALHQAKQAVGADYMSAVEYHDTQIFRAFLFPSLVGQSTGTGSYALGKTHYDLFVLMLEEQCKNLSNINVDQFLKPFIVAHFGPQSDYGKFAIEDFQQDDEKLMFEAFLSGVNSGIIKPGLEKDLNRCRERTGFDPLTQAEIDSQSQVLPNTAEKDPQEEPPRPETGSPAPKAAEDHPDGAILSKNIPRTMWPSRPRQVRPYREDRKSIFAR